MSKAKHIQSFPLLGNQMKSSLRTAVTIFKDRLKEQGYSISVRMPVSHCFSPHAISVGILPAIWPRQLRNSKHLSRMRGLLSTDQLMNGRCDIVIGRSRGKGLSWLSNTRSTLYHRSIHSRTAGDLIPSHGSVVCWRPPLLKYRLLLEKHARGSHELQT